MKTTNYQLIGKQYDLQFYDSLLLATAKATGCETFLTEDLNDGQAYDWVKTVSPFRNLNMP